MHLHMRYRIIFPLRGSNLGRLAYSQDTYTDRKQVSYAIRDFPHITREITEQVLAITGALFLAPNL